MAYNERIKDFNKIRDYMREFYVNGFKSRDEYTQKSSRSYDDMRRRIDSWLGDYMRFNQDSDGKHAFLSIDSRKVKHNPLYKAWKTKSFTDGDITLHFILFDIFSEADSELTLGDIIDSIEGYLTDFDNAKNFDESTIRKKLKEYVELGIVEMRKEGRTSYYSKCPDYEPLDSDFLDFYSEVAPCGVIGSFLLDKDLTSSDHFSFKHHYITSTMDSDIRCDIFMAMQDKRSIEIETINRSKPTAYKSVVVPLYVFVSVQNGRQHLMAYVPAIKKFRSYRIDNILSVKASEVCQDFNKLRIKFDEMRPNIWGVSLQGDSKEELEHVEFTIRYDEGEYFIPQRLEREKRYGTVEHLEKGISKFSADVFDSRELFPWIRTFISRIVSISFSNKMLEEKFMADISKMYEMYGLTDVSDDATNNGGAQ